MLQFEGTDLSMAYGGFSDPQVYQQQAPPSAPSVQSMSLPPVVQQPPPPPKQEMVALQQPSEVHYNPPEAMYMQQPQPAYAPPSEGFFDRLSAHRYDVLKVVMFAFVILLAIALDRFFMHYLSGYVANSVLTYTQELLVRLAYPVGIILVIWFIKAM